MNSWNFRKIKFSLSLLVLSSIFFKQEADGAVLVLPSSSSRKNSVFDQGARQDYEDEEEGSAPVPRIKDVADGIDGLLQGISSNNANKFLEGSLAFIPSPFRVGVKEILGSIVGRPIISQKTKATTKATTLKSKVFDDDDEWLNTRKKTSSKPEATTELETDSEEQIIDGIQ